MCSTKHLADIRLHSNKLSRHNAEIITHRQRTHRAEQQHDIERLHFAPLAPQHDCRCQIDQILKIFLEMGQPHARNESVRKPVLMTDGRPSTRHWRLSAIWKAI